MRYPRPDSPFHRLLLDTKYIRILGNAVLPTYLATVDNGVKLRLRTTGGDRGVAEEIFLDRIYERYFKPELGQTVVDAGAHIGCFTLRAATLVGESGHVLSFEPSTQNYMLLSNNVSMNGLRNIRTFNCGLSSREGEAELLLSSNTGSNSLFSRTDQKISVVAREKVQLRQLDSIVDDLNLSQVDLIKLDAEGAELEILHGAERILSKFHPKIVGEAHPAFSASAEAILRLLSQFGYQGNIDQYHSRLQIFYAWPTDDRTSP